MTTSKPSALDALRGLAKKTAPATSALATQVNDPAIAGAKRDKNTVKLGFDPAIAATAQRCAELREALARAEAEFTVDQAAMRDYGSTKRGLYGDAFKCDVTTVCVPYTVEVPGGHETKWVQVICSKKWSIQQDMVLANKDVFGASYERMFVEETVKTVKPNAEELIRNLLTETAGLTGDDLEATMGQLFDTNTTVKARGENFEEESKKLPDAAKAVLDQACTRSQPALKFV
jgi:hypothetical protein